MGFVERHDQVGVRRFKRADLGQRGAVAVHAENRFGGHKHGFKLVGATRQLPFEAFEVVVGKAQNDGTVARSREHSVDHARVHELVGKDQEPLLKKSAKRCHPPGVGVPPRSKEQNGAVFDAAGSVKTDQSLFKRRVRGAFAHQQGRSR